MTLNLTIDERIVRQLGKRAALAKGGRHESGPTRLALALLAEAGQLESRGDLTRAARKLGVSRQRVSQIVQEMREESVSNG